LALYIATLTTNPVAVANDCQIVAKTFAAIDVAQQSISNDAAPLGSNEFRLGKFQNFLLLLLLLMLMMMGMVVETTAMKPSGTEWWVGYPPNTLDLMMPSMLLLLFAHHHHYFLPCYSLLFSNTKI